VEKVARERLIMKININNIDAITESIEKVEGKASARKLWPTDVCWAAGEAEAKLEHICLPKKYRVGCKVVLAPQKVCNKYKYIAQGTFAVLERFSSGWFLVSVTRANTGSASNGSRPKITLSLSEEAKKNLPSIFQL
jgi:hypothetical protein